MSNEQNILTLFDQYFEVADKNEILEDIGFVNSLGKQGMSFEEYLQNLNAIAAIPLAETGICDDIAYRDLYNSLISPISMDDYSRFQTIESIYFQSVHSDYIASENTYPMAA
jgi:hypothetical protein